jgi:hypothetical protein
MASVLSFSDYLGGPDNIQIEQIFPSTQRTLQYNFGTDISDWNFTADYQTIVVDSMAFDRNTGLPNFANSIVIGYFPQDDITGDNFSIVNAGTGAVNITIPGGLYTGPVLPDARKNVPITIVGVTWEDASIPKTQINTHRWAFIMSYEPGVGPTDPTQDPDYTAIG